MGAFAEAQTCRRLVLLNYFGEGRQEPCGTAIFASIRQNSTMVQPMRRLPFPPLVVNQRFGMGYVVEVIRGANNQRIRDYGHDKLKVYGMGRDKSHEHWVSVIRQLIHLGPVTQNIAQHLCPQLTEAARPVLRGESSCNLPCRVSWRSNRKRCRNRSAATMIANCSPNYANCVNRLPMKAMSRRTWCLTTQPLIEMAEQMPITASEMLSVNGVGMRKLERFGKPFMALIRAHVDGDDEE